MLTSAPARPAPALVARLASYDDRPALVCGDRTVDYAELADRVDAFADRLGTTRRLVLVEGANTVDAVVAYLGALAAGSPVLLSGDAAVDNLALAYRPDVVVTAEEGVTEVRAGSAHDLHPDLALLLSTSGSTGSPKLVRLSHANLDANAAAIAGYLGLGAGAGERHLAATTLPMHYCYGLSVLNSHLYAGAAVLLTERSVVEPAFWEEFRAHRATSFAGVPYTFELLDRTGFADLELPHLRQVTQAGGRLAPDDVRRYAELGRLRGFDFVVMYGQTEATARMAYLPPELAAESPGAIGVPIPGGSFTLEPLPERPLDGGPLDVGELVYDGPNVMLGYAEAPAELALGRTVTSLRTGDVARLRPDGLYEIVGRRSRVAKVYGLRLDLDHLEQVLAAAGVVVAAADGGDRLVLGVCSGARPVPIAGVLELVRTSSGLPPAGVVVVPLAELPRLPSGKTDYRALTELAAQREAAAPPADSDSGADLDLERRLATLYAGLLGRPAGPDDSFVGLGGDSLSYVEVSLRLERLLGHLPADWHTRPISALADAGATDRPARRGVALETNLLLRAVAIVSIVATHANLVTLLGGAHVLIALVGFNFARFQVTGAPRAERTRSIVRAAARIAVPSAVVIAIVSLWTPGLGWPQILLVNGLKHTWWVEPAWHYWFIEASVHTLLLLACFLAIPAVDRAERRWPFGLPFALALVGLLTRYEIVALRGGDDMHRAHVVFWLFAIGWATARARTRRHRLLLSALAVASVPGFFGEPWREVYVVLGLLLLIWVPQVRVPARVAGLASVLAGASLWIYLVHWEVYPWLENRVPVLATLSALAAGVLVQRVVGRRSFPGYPGKLSLVRRCNP
ncbi:MAG TPA: AMP-binding protein [Nocardioides sp.]